MTKQIIQPIKMLMKCGHCSRNTGLLHGGSGPSLCCECVSSHRRWLWLGGNQYADDSEHVGGQWCSGAIEPVWTFANNYAVRSGVTVEWLAENGREVRTCDCNEKDCEGLQMAHVKDSLWEHPSLPYPAQPSQN